MSQNREHETDEPQGVKYPSPDAEVMDSGPFYNTGSREDDQDHQENHDHLHGHVDMHEHEHADLSGQEAGTPQEHLSRPANLEELQLAAQLGHGLAGTTIMPATDPNMHVDDPNLRSIMPHPDPEDHDDTSYVQDASNADSMVQHPIQASLLSGQYGVGSDGIPPRKRSKVSRACDECRRKVCETHHPLPLSFTRRSPCRISRHVLISLQENQMRRHLRHGRSTVLELRTILDSVSVQPRTAEEGAKQRVRKRQWKYFTGP